MGEARRTDLVVAALTASSLAVISWLSLRTPAPQRLADLQVYQGALAQWRSGGQLYDYHRSNGDVFTYPPFAGQVLSWLNHVSTSTAQILWTASSALLIVSFAALLWWAHIPRSTRTLPYLVLFAVISAPSRSNLEFGQISIAVIVLAAADLLLVKGKAQGLLLGIAISIKLTPALFVPLLWLSGRRRAALTATVATAALTALAWLRHPLDSQTYWLHELHENSRFVNATIPANQSLQAALQRAHAPSVNLLWLVASLVVIVYSLWIGTRLARSDQWLPAVIVTGTASLIVSPITWTHHQFWLLGAVCLGPPTGRIRWYRAVVVLVMVAGVIGNSRLALACSVLALGGGGISSVRTDYPVIGDGRLADDGDDGDSARHA